MPSFRVSTKPNDHVSPRLRLRMASLKHAVGLPTLERNSKTVSEVPWSFLGGNLFPTTAGPGSSLRYSRSLGTINARLQSL